jgi:hypothetical protein
MLGSAGDPVVAFWAGIERRPPSNHSRHPPYSGQLPTRGTALILGIAAFPLIVMLMALKSCS